jgi:putative ABC transport system permease protein
MKTVSIAVRNLLRNRRRSLATLLAMAIGVASILLFGGYSASIIYTMQTAYVRAGGHLQIQHRDFYQYGSGNPTAYGIEDYQRIVGAILGDSVLREAIVVATPTLQFGGIAGNYAKGVSRTVLGVGVVAKDQSRMRHWNEFDVSLPSPSLALDGSSADSAIVGTALGRVLRLCEALQISNCPAPAQESRPEGPAVADDIAQLSRQETPAQDAPSSAQGGGRTIELLASSARGTPNVASLQVISAEPQAFKELDEVYMMLHLQQAQRLIYGVAAPKATSIMVQLNSASQIPMVRQRLESLLATLAPHQPLVVLDFKSLNPFYVQSQQLFDTIFGFIYCLIGGIVLFTVGNTMNMAVVERTVEIGTLRSIGVRRGGIRRLFVVEGLLLGVAGAFAGLISAFLAAWAVNHAGLTWLPPGSAQSIPLAIRIWGEGKMLATATVGLIMIATVSALWPAHRAARMIIVDALRHT